MKATGTFDVDVRPQGALLESEGVKLARVEADKRFAGPLDATGQVHMLSAHTPVAGSAGYVALERIAGTLQGRAGTFVVAHLGTMSAGDEQLSIAIVPDSGTGQLTGIRGNMGIRIEAGQHYYWIDWTLPGAGD